MPRLGEITDVALETEERWALTNTLTSVRSIHGNEAARHHSSSLPFQKSLATQTVASPTGRREREEASVVIAALGGGARSPKQ